MMIYDEKNKTFWFEVLRCLDLSTHKKKYYHVLELSEVGCESGLLLSRL